MSNSHLHVKTRLRLTNPDIGGMRPILESNLWSIFKCLVNALTVLDRGQEDPKVPWDQEKWPHHAIVHFDIKPMNSESINTIDLAAP